MGEILLKTCQPIKVQTGRIMKTIFPKQKEIEVRLGILHKSTISPSFTRENNSHPTDSLSQMFTKEHHTDFK